MSPFKRSFGQAEVPPYFDTQMGRAWLEDAYQGVMQTCPSTISSGEEGVDPSVVDEETGEQWNRRVQILSGQGLPALVSMEKRLKTLRSEVQGESRWDLEGFDGQSSIFRSNRKLVRHRHVITKSLVDLYTIFGAVIRWGDLKDFIGAAK